MPRFKICFDDAEDKVSEIEADNTRDAIEQFARDNGCTIDESNVYITDERGRQFTATIEPRLEFDVTIDRRCYPAFPLTLAHLDDAKKFHATATYKVVSIDVESGVVSFERLT